MSDALDPTTPVTSAPSSRLTDARIRELFLTPVLVRESRRESAFLETARVRTLPFGQTPLTLYEWGEGPVVLLVHGWGGRAAQLASFVEPLTAAGHRVIGVDAPAHGRTPGRRSSLFEFADMVRHLAIRTGGARALIAHSMGAASSLMAIGDGAPIERAILFAPICRLSDVVSRFVARLQLDADQRARLERSLEADHGAGMWERSSLVHVASSLSVPGLVVHDRDDLEIPYQDGVDTVAAWAGAELVTSEGLGHRTILRHPDLVARAVRFVAGSVVEGDVEGSR